MYASSQGFKNAGKQRNERMRETDKEREKEMEGKCLSRSTLLSE
jgi:hypothetical protein